MDLLCSRSNSSVIHLWEWKVIVKGKVSLSTSFFFFSTQFCVKPYVPREPRRDPSNRRLNEHGIYILHCQASNSRPVPSQAGADTTRPQWHLYKRWLTLSLPVTRTWIDFSTVYNDTLVAKVKSGWSLNHLHDKIYYWKMFRNYRTEI